VHCCYHASSPASAKVQCRPLHRHSCWCHSWLWVALVRTVWNLQSLTGLRRASGAALVAAMKLAARLCLNQAVDGFRLLVSACHVCGEALSAHMHL
jgi:hypothetical protein